MTDPRVLNAYFVHVPMPVPSGQCAAACWCTNIIINLMHATDTFMRLGQIPGLDIEVKQIPMIIAVMLAALLAHSNLAVIVSGGVGKNGSTVAVSVELTIFSLVCLWLLL